MQHGLVFGDIRMIHDPLRSRARASLFGVVALVLGMMAAGLMAWVAPQANPGQAPIVRTEDGSLHVWVGERLHPVTNLASARLITGEPGAPAAIGAQHFAEAPKGPLMGIFPAPGAFSQTSDASFVACHDDAGTVGVEAVPHNALPTPLGVGEAVLVSSPTGDWVLTAAGRNELPSEESPEGRALRRAVGISPETPRLDVSGAGLSAISEREPWTVPDGVTLLNDATTTFAQHENAAIAVTSTQERILKELGVTEERVSASRVAQLAPMAPLPLPEDKLRFIDPLGMRVCSLPGGGVGTAPGGLRGAELPGDAPAGHFAGLESGAVVVDTGAGHQVVTPHGLRHEVAPGALDLLGAPAPVAADHRVIDLLPRGPVLDTQAARTPVAY
ncbi:type VII secretion protein EccB [Corynebacterium tapiri]